MKAEDKKRLLFETDSIISDLAHVKASLSATVYLMKTGARKPEPKSKDLRVWLKDLEERLDCTICKVSGLQLS